ncbi:MAG: hypothetical protein BJ554DRAFT_1198 [Olpidium bornovanus]|uniref:Reverse transcriptase Ty1/copia-type domain-containing protein n=1 Tax=Olpidium bornovanus TaxID=278681 RepID=A0A8H7ZSP4_9FUNG|nr:MAG: hypothetical protein BJ554DRAFT_1198 [Olpidium bornovanus]
MFLDFWSVLLSAQIWSYGNLWCIYSRRYARGVCIHTGAGRVGARAGFPMRMAVRMCGIPMWAHRSRAGGGTLSLTVVKLTHVTGQGTRGIDFDEAYAPVVSHQALRLLLAVATAERWVVRSHNMVTAYLKARLHHKVFIEQPPGVRFLVLFSFLFVLLPLVGTPECSRTTTSLLTRYEPNPDVSSPCLSPSALPRPRARAASPLRCRRCARRSLASPARHRSFAIASAACAPSPPPPLSAEPLLPPSPLQRRSLPQRRLSFARRAIAAASPARHRFPLAAAAASFLTAAALFAAAAAPELASPSLAPSSPLPSAPSSPSPGTRARLRPRANAIFRSPLSSPPPLLG